MYAVVVMILGVLAYGYIIASVAASLANADSGRAQYQEKLEGIKSFMRVRAYSVPVAALVGDKPQNSFLRHFPLYSM